MATDTQRSILEYLTDNYGIGRRGTQDGGGSSSAIADASVFAGPRGGETIALGSELLLTLNADSAGNAPEGDLVRLSSRPSDSAGSMNVTPNFTAAIANSDTFIVLSLPFTFDSGAFAVRQAIDKALLKIPELLTVPLTMFTDGDMLATSPTDDWGTPSNATPTKVAATFPLGLRVLRVTASADAGYALTNNIPVEENKSYYLEATGMIGSTGAEADAGTLQAIDVTNSNASISLDNSAIDRFEPEVLANNVTMPSGCEQMHVRLAATLNGDIIDWSNLIFYKNGTQEFLVQDRAEVDRLGQLFYASGATWRERELVELGHELEQRPSGLWVYHTAPVSGRALFYEEFRKAAALGTTLTNSTGIPKEELAAVAAWILLEPLLADSRWSGFARKAMGDAALVRTKYKAQRSTVRRVAKSVPLLEM
ncbi:hypothetical protein LCGC14_1692820 [marine sediment metagenome]|uniref:Uncharacterized protein n=1 Tax=marine sediment metagenome TaxID=412755 RepID=A0A0F9K0T3_9ZZZZ